MMMGSQGLFQASEAMQSKRSDIDALDLYYLYDLLPG